MTDLDGVKLAVTVKPLVWDDLTGSGTRFRSYDGLMTYTISRIVQDDTAYFRWARSQGGWSDVFYDADACKDAAQADYDRRILSALSPTPEAPGTGLGSGETEWIGDFLNRRTDVEKVLRDVKRGKRQALSPEECWELANRLSVPANHGGA